MFNSDINIDHIQKLIIERVRQDLGVTIPPQNRADLINLLRAVYTQDPTRDLVTLNNEAVRQAVRIIEPGVRMNIYYQGNSGTIPPPLPLPQNVSTRGQKMNESTIGFSRP